MTAYTTKNLLISNVDIIATEMNAVGNSFAGDVLEKDYQSVAKFSNVIEHSVTKFLRRYNLSVTNIRDR